MSVAGPVLRGLGRGAAYAAFLGLLGVFSTSPAYTYVSAGHGRLTLSLSHPGELKVECRTRSAEEIARLAPNMRRALDCPRERLPVRVRLRLDGETLLDRELSPSGLWGDGSATLYSKFDLPAGRHDLELALRDSDRAEGFDHRRRLTVVVAPREHVVVEFDSEHERFVVQGAEV